MRNSLGIICKKDIVAGIFCFAAGTCAIISRDHRRRVVNWKLLIMHHRTKRWWQIRIVEHIRLLSPAVTVHYHHAKVEAVCVICWFPPDSWQAKLQFSFLPSVPRLQSGPTASANHVGCPTVVLVPHLNSKVRLVSRTEEVPFNDGVLDWLDIQKDSTDIAEVVRTMLAGTSSRSHHETISVKKRTNIIRRVKGKKRKQNATYIKWLPEWTI